MRKTIALLLTLALALAGCSGGTDKNTTAIKPAATEQENSANETDRGTNEAAEGPEYVYIQPEMKGEITIAIGTIEGVEYHQYLENASRRFMEKYPEVEVVINEYVRGMAGQMFGDAYRININTRLAAGKAEDIIFMEGDLQIEKYVKLGVPADFSPFIAATPEMNEDNYYMNALKAGSFGEKIYVLPYTIDFPTVVLDGDLVAEGKVNIDKDKKKMSYSEARDLATRMVQASSLKGAFVDTASGEEWHIRQLIYENLDHYVDTINLKASFNTMEYIELLKQVKDLYQDKTLFPDDIDFYDGEEHHWGCFPDNSGIMQTALFALFPEGTAPPDYTLPQANADGTVVMQGSGDFFLNNASDNKELSWEFIKFLLSEEMQSDPSLYFLPVNRKAAATAVGKEVKNWQERGGSAQVSAEDAITLIDGWVEQVGRFDFIDPVIMNWLYEENDKFFKDEQSAEETAQNLQTKVTQYFNE